MRLQVRATADKPATIAWLLAVGVGLLVMEDWASRGSVQLFSVTAQTGLDAAGGNTGTTWDVQKVHHRNVTAPVTALACSEGNLVISYGHHVRSHPPRRLTTCAVYVQSATCSTHIPVCEL